MDVKEFETARSALDHLLDPMVAVDKQGIITYCNRAFAHMINVRKRTRIPGQALAEYVCLVVEDRTLNPVEESRRAGRPVTWREVRAEVADHGTMSLWMSVLPLLDGEEWVGALLDMADKTEEERVHVKYREIFAAQERSFRETLRLLSSLVELRDKRTGAHSRGVASHARLIAEELKLPDETTHSIEMAAMLHDIGKIGISDDLVHRREDSMNDAELKQYRMHPELGQACLQGVEALDEAGVIVRHHHERWDGSGFPDRLAGEAIPLGSRIIAVADAYQNASERGGRGDEQTSRDGARRVLEAGSGTRFDPTIVDALINSLSARSRRLERDMVPAQLSMDALKPGMILEEDLVAPNGLLLVPAGEALALPVMRRVQNFMGMGGMDRKLKVLVPREEKEAEDARLEAAAKEAEEEVLDKAREHVLVADDNSVTRRLLHEVLTGAGYAVMTASTGVRTLELLARERPDLLVLDLALPDMDGLRILRHVKNDPQQQAMPVVICTAKKDRTILVEAIRAGAADVVLKPFSSAAVVQKIWRCLESPQMTMADRLREEAARREKTPAAGAATSDTKDPRLASDPKLKVSP